MVLAGGCVSGCLYKAATGNLNSIVAVLMIPVGIMLVEFGPLNPLQSALKSYVISTPEGEKLSLPALTGIPFWVWALIFGLATLVVGTRKLLSNPARPKPHKPVNPVEKVLTKPWKAWQAGVGQREKLPARCDPRCHAGGTAAD